MSAQKKEGFTRIVSDLQPHELLKLAVSIRDTYVQQVARTQEKLDPARLRGLNDSIDRLRAALN